MAAGLGLGYQVALGRRLDAGYEVLASAVRAGLPRSVGEAVSDWAWPVLVGGVLVFSTRTLPVQACCWLMLTSQVMPKRSVHMPNTSPHICFSSGTETVPLPESLSQ